MVQSKREREREKERERERERTARRNDLKMVPMFERNKNRIKN